MGEVYRARDTRLGRIVAIRVLLSTHVAVDEELKHRFEREARTLAALSHPHICPVFDVGQQDGVDYLVMEYLDGETLSERLARGALPLDQLLRYATDIADALDKAHRRDIVHRDLKPGNIMLTNEGAILLDFGLAKRTAVGPSRGLSTVATQSAPLTGQGTILGTLQYMAPVQLEGHDADARSDVFAFGAMVYEMATGRRAFEATSRVGLMAAIVGQDPPPVSSIQPLSPVLLDHLVSTCLLKDPDSRWQSMADVLIQLRLIADRGAGLVAQPTRSRRSAVLAWSVGVACLAIGAVLGAMVMSRRGAPEASRFAFEVEGPTESVGAPLQFSLSPNGAHLVSVVGSDRGSVLSGFAHSTAR
jgi:serine/threonine protein kinase